MPPRNRGRRPIWCSPRCRRLASAERVAAQNAGAAVRVVEVPRAHRPDADARLPAPSMAVLTRLFLSSDFQCRLLLESLETRYAADKLGDELRTAVDQLATTVHRQQALADDPPYRQAVEDVQRLRQHLAFDAERSDAREAEIVNLRSELRRKNGEIEDLHEALARARTEGDRSPQLASQALSRQQRRAVERASRKSQL